MKNIRSITHRCGQADELAETGMCDENSDAKVDDPSAAVWQLFGHRLNYICRRVLSDNFKELEDKAFQRALAASLSASATRQSNKNSQNGYSTRRQLGFIDSGSEHGTNPRTWNLQRFTRAFNSPSDLITEPENIYEEILSPQQTVEKSPFVADKSQHKGIIITSLLPSHSRQIETSNHVKRNADRETKRREGDQMVVIADGHPMVIADGHPMVIADGHRMVIAEEHQRKCAVGQSTSSNPTMTSTTEHDGDRKQRFPTGNRNSDDFTIDIYADQIRQLSTTVLAAHAQVRRQEPGCYGGPQRPPQHPDVRERVNFTSRDAQLVGSRSRRPLVVVDSSTSVGDNRTTLGKLKHANSEELISNSDGRGQFSSRKRLDSMSNKKIVCLSELDLMVINSR